VELHSCWTLALLTVRDTLGYHPYTYGCYPGYIYIVQEVEYHKYPNTQTQHIQTHLGITLIRTGTALTAS
uniref:Uncharacterized protein n=1 Tax=Aegilops tauschii subsp. strangulata TaxID=200361 RepID=A0A453REQ7_AEGTS